VGAFGSDHADRPELPAVAVRRAREQTGVEYGGKEIVILGDTPFDITCGAHLGVRTIAVATGRHSAEDLASHAPTTSSPTSATPTPPGRRSWRNEHEPSVHGRFER
jgi:phosphoglycolate phosphatase-like HAD superfamily hydrolase